MDRRAELVEQVTGEVMRVLPDFNGNRAEYSWLLATYDVSEEDDVKWSTILEWEQGQFDDGPGGDHDYTEEEFAAHEAFLDDDAGVIAFLEALLAKYKASDAVYPAA